MVHVMAIPNPGQIVRTVTKRCNLVLLKRRRCCAARKVTADLAGSNGGLPIGI